MSLVILLTKDFFLSLLIVFLRYIKGLKMKKYLAEFLGTFILVFCGTGAIIINEVTQGTVTHVGIALTFGAVVLSMIYSFGDISGAHINPAVTLAFGLSGKFNKNEILPYIISQLLGAFLGSILLKYLFPQPLVS